MPTIFEAEHNAGYRRLYQILVALHGGPIFQRRWRERRYSEREPEVWRSNEGRPGTGQNSLRIFLTCTIKKLWLVAGGGGI
jgi:hypothetical protein